VSRSHRSGGRADGKIWQSPGRNEKREHDEVSGHGPERGSEDGFGRTGVNTSPKGRAVRGARGAGREEEAQAERGRRAGCGRWRRVGDDREDTHAAAAYSAAGDVEREGAGEEIGPTDASGAGRRFGGVTEEGEVQARAVTGTGGVAGLGMTCSSSATRRSSLAATSMPASYQSHR